MNSSSINARLLQIRWRGDSKWNAVKGQEKVEILVGTLRVAQTPFEGPQALRSASPLRHTVPPIRIRYRSRALHFGKSYLNRSSVTPKPLLTLVMAITLLRTDFPNRRRFAIKRSVPVHSFALSNYRANAFVAPSLSLLSTLFFALSFHPLLRYVTSPSFLRARPLVTANYHD